MTRTRSVAALLMMSLNGAGVLREACGCACSAAKAQMTRDQFIDMSLGGSDEMQNVSSIRYSGKRKNIQVRCMAWQRNEHCNFLTTGYRSHS